MLSTHAPAPAIGHRLRKLDEANGQVAHTGNEFDEHTDNGLMTERTGHVHQGTKQDIVRQWLEGAEQVPPSTGTFVCSETRCDVMETDAFVRQCIPQSR